MVFRPSRLAFVGLSLLAGSADAAEIAREDRRSGFDFMSLASRAMQADDSGNPGMLWVLQGEQLWNEAPNASAKSCAGCHGDGSAMRGVAARYPAFDAAQGRPIDLDGRINLCRTENQSAPPLVRESEPLLALSAFVAEKSRGLPIAPPEDARLAPFREQGGRLWQTRIGQLDLACASCHDDNWRGRLGGSPVTQGHPTAYPLYRLEWQSLGSLQRRMRNCMIGVRATPFEPGSPEFVNLELFLKARAAGLPVESPGVRP